MLFFSLSLTLSCASAPLGALPPPSVPTPPALSQLTVPAFPVGAGVNDPELRALWEQGRTFAAFVADAEALEEEWRGNRERARIPQDVARRVDALDSSWRILVVAAARCHDSANNIPPLARLARYSDHLELRMVTPDQGGQSVMDARPTPDGRAATPTVVILDENGDEAGCWIERPARQREFYMQNLKGAERGSDSWRAAVQDFFGWYEEDNGASALREIMDVLEAAENGARGCAPAA